MGAYTVTFLPENKAVSVPEGTTLLRAQMLAGLQPDAPCGGNGSCGKCRVIVDGTAVSACKTRVDRDLTVQVPEKRQMQILTEGLQVPVSPDGVDGYAIAFDVGTTTVAAWLLDGHSGKVLAQGSCPNPQRRFGADVVTRLQCARKGEALSPCIRDAIAEITAQLAERAGIGEEQITAASVAGNTAMHHLLLGIDPKPLLTPPYMPAVRELPEREGRCRVRILPNIAGFVGGDTVGCLLATRFDRLQELTLLIDIGTNGEMVLGKGNRRIACSTAAGPAFEGAKISCGMGAAQGAVDHVWPENGEIKWHTIGDAPPAGLCGSGLLDLVAVLLDTGRIDKTGRMREKSFRLCENVELTRKDVREVQLAKAAIRAGMELLVQELGTQTADIRRVYLAGAFGNYLNPDSACRIGMIPPELRGKIRPVGNAAGVGAQLCALSREEFMYSLRLARETEFLELGGVPEFQKRYLDALNFPE